MALPITALEYNESGKKYEFDVTKFSEIASSDEIKDLPIAVISIIGESRKGKSFLLNYFLRYLQRYDQEDWLGDPNEPLQGFLWTQGAESCTTGIVLWPEPLIVTRKDGTKIAVILMDTQGLFVDATEQEDCNYIFAISSFLSSIQVYNQQENILTNDVTLLSRLAEYSKEKLKITGYKGIQKLLLLIRDWSANCVYPFGADGGKQFLDSKRNNQSQFHKDWQTIHDCYSQVDCFLMPHPGLQATRRGFEGEISKLDAHFTNVLRELVENLLSPENIVIKTNNGKEMKMWEFVAFFKNISENLQKDGFILYDEFLDIDFENQARNASMMAMAEFLKKYTELNPRKDAQRVNYSILVARASATLFYYEKTKDIDSEIAVNYLEDFNDSLDDYLEKFFNRYAAGSTEESSESSSQNSWYQRMYSGFSTVASFLFSHSGTTGFVLDVCLEIFENYFHAKTSARKNQRRNRQRNQRRR